MTAVYTIAGPDFRPGMRQDYIAVLDRMESIRDSRTLAPKHYPLLVTFDDISDPASVRRVDPGDLAASFGPGYRLNAITLSITDEPVTEGRVKKVLGWLCDYKSKRMRLSGQTGPIGDRILANNVGSGDFKNDECE